MAVLPQECSLQPSGQHSRVKAWLKGSCNPSSSCKSLANTSFPSTSGPALSLDLKSESYIPEKLNEDFQFSYPCSSAYLTLCYLLKPVSFPVFISCMDDKSLLLSTCRRQQASKQEALLFSSDSPPQVQICQKEYIECV